MRSPCKCRFCNKVYDENKTRADYKGYCSQKCFHDKAKALGYRKGQTEMRKGWKTPQPVTEYDVLKRHGQVGSVPATNVQNTVKNILVFDQLSLFLERCGVQYIFIESGDASMLTKCEELGIDYSPEYKFWCELSWGSGDDEFDFAFADFGPNLGQALTGCMNAFIQTNTPEVLRAKKKYRWRL